MATITGSFNSLVSGTLSGTIGTPGPAGATGATGATGAAGAPGSPGVGVPAAGSTGQVLQKLSGVNYDTGWLTLPADYITSVTAPLAVTSGVLAVDLSAYSTTAQAAALYYPLSGNPSGFLTASALTPYLTSATAASTYQTLAGMSSYLTTSAAASTYAVIAAGQPVSGTVGQVLTKNSGTNYDSIWTTIVPGDRYLTTSTTSNTVSNGNKTFTIGTGLSYTPTQNITISYDASNHMHGEVLTYNSGTGVLTVDVNNHTGSGTYASWVVNVGGVTPATSVAWGDLTGTLSTQTDLQNALDLKLDVTTAASTYFTIASAAGKANLSGATFTGKVNLATISVATPSINLGGQCDPAPASAANGDIWISNAAAPKLTYRMGGVNYNLPVLNQFNTFTNQMVIDTASSATSALRVTQRGAGNAIEVEDSTTPDATKFVVDQFGKVGIGVAPDTTAALKVDTNGIMFGDGTTQTTASPPFVYESSSFAASLSGGGYLSVFQPGQVYVQDTITNLYTAITADGITFPNGSIQTVAANNTIPDAPSDGNYYVRKDGAWIACTVVSIYDSNSSASYNCLTV